MSEEKHFNYEGNVDLRTPSKSESDVEVIGVEFMTPARITLKMGEQQTSVMVNIDIINRMVYDQQGNSLLSDAVFSHLDAVNTLPEDFFAAPEEISKAAADAEAEQMMNKEEILGDYNE